MKIVFLMVTLLLLAISEKERQSTKRRPRQPRQEQQSPQSTQTYLKRFRQSRSYRFLVRLGEGILILAALGQAAVAFWGPFWPTRPEIQFHDTIDASSFVLPFKMINRSVLFGMYDVDVKCGVDLLYFMDADEKTGVLRDAVFSPGPISIDRDSFTNYPCTASSYVQIRPDGSVIIGFIDGQFMTSPPSAFRAPLTVLKMCLWINGNYRIFGYPVSFKSKTFQWPAIPNQRQWIEGPVTPDLPNEAWIPKNSSIEAVWGMRRMMTPDKMQFLPGALQCTRMK